MNHSVIFPAWLGLVLAACGTPANAPQAPGAQVDAPVAAASRTRSDTDTRSGDAPRTIRLSAADVAHLGIVLTPVQTARYVDTVDGFAVVVGREAIAQAVTDVVAARAASRQSHATLERMRRLAGGAGADSASVREGAERQAVADDAALDLAQAKAFSTLGRLASTPDPSATLLHDLAGGRTRLLRVTFPLGTFVKEGPQNLRVHRLDDGTDVGRVGAIGPAPAEGTLPGRSYFATLAGSEVDDGERLLARATEATHAAPLVGVLVPAAALVVQGDRYGFYLQHEPGEFTHEAIDINRSLPGGYFVTDGIHAGDAVVTQGAGLLLAHESDPAGAEGTDP